MGTVQQYVATQVTVKRFPISQIPPQSKKKQLAPTKITPAETLQPAVAGPAADTVPSKPPSKGFSLGGILDSVATKAKELTSDAKNFIDEQINLGNKVEYYELMKDHYPAKINPATRKALPAEYQDRHIERYYGTDNKTYIHVMHMNEAGYSNIEAVLIEERTEAGTTAIRKLYDGPMSNDAGINQSKAQQNAAAQPTPDSASDKDAEHEKMVQMLGLKPGEKAEYLGSYKYGVWDVDAGGNKIGRADSPKRILIYNSKTGKWEAI